MASTFTPRAATFSCIAFSSCIAAASFSRCSSRESDSAASFMSFNMLSCWALISPASLLHSLCWVSSARLSVASVTVLSAASNALWASTLQVSIVSIRSSRPSPRSIISVRLSSNTNTASKRPMASCCIWLRRAFAFLASSVRRSRGSVVSARSINISVSSSTLSFMSWRCWFMFLYASLICFRSFLCWVFSARLSAASAILAFLTLATWTAMASARFISLNLLRAKPSGFSPL